MDFVVLWLKPPINSDVIWKRKADAVIFVSSSSPRVEKEKRERERELEVSRGDILRGMQCMDMEIWIIHTTFFRWMGYICPNWVQRQKRINN